MITPTIGRKVWFHPSGEADGDQPLDATIAYVHNDELINIGYRDKFGNTASAQEIQLWDGVNEAERPVGEAYCEWMPYQKTQAAAADTSKVAVGDKVAALLKT
jgi:erythromycin esterase-like protein